MNKMRKAAALTLVFALAAGLAPAHISDAKKNNKGDKSDKKVTVKSISIRNKEDFSEVEEGSTVKIKYTVKLSTGGTKSERKKAKKVKFSTSDQKVATVNEKGVVTAVSAGACRITVKSVSNSKKKATVSVEVSSKLDMVFKYSNLYFIVPDGAPFPVTVAQGDEDNNGSTFDIKTLEFDGKLSDFTYASENPGVAAISAEDGKLVLYGYGSTEIEATYNKEDEVGDTIKINVYTQEQFDAAKASGEIAPETENNFEDEPDENNENDNDE